VCWSDAYEIARSYGFTFVGRYTRCFIGDENKSKVAKNKLVISADKKYSQA